MRIDFGNFRIPAVTLVANEFIDQYMPSANGEYVKVYLYLLRHAGEETGQAEIADALELTEGDVRRALIRWQRDGLLKVDGDGAAEKRPPEEAPAAAAAAERRAVSTGAPEGGFGGRPQAPVPGGAREESRAQIPQNTAARASVPAELAPAPAERNAPAVPDKSGVDFSKLRENDEFTTLLYIVQRYLSRIFSQTDSETVAYLYDVLKMPAELIEYLAELCAQRGKTSLRYFESIALDWYRSGIRTVEQAKEQGTNASGEEYAVMKAFGLKGRNPGTEEQKLIRKWFGEYGFTKEIVLEACGRTLLRTHEPSFPYADRILTEWHRAGVRTPEDILRLDDGLKQGTRERKGAFQGTGNRSGAKQATRFHNLNERDDDLDAYSLQAMRQRLGQE